MNITFTPMRRDDTLMLMLSRSGDTLTINSEAFDFSGIPDGATLPRDAIACDWLASDVERIGGAIHLTLILPHGPNAPQETLFPVAITPTDGVIVLPDPDLPESPAKETP
jgi:hypothetical protein